MRSGERTLTPTEAAAVYDRVGRWQDTQAFYERAAVDDLVRTAELEKAQRVLEVGCGTGALAARLLARTLPPTARYLGLDVSARMVALTRDRLRAWADRAEVRQIDGSGPWPVDDASYDRVVATYVLDLLPADGVDRFFAEAGRALADGGVVAVTSLAPGEAGLPRVVSTAWTRLWRTSPHLTGGCRPIDVAAHVPSGWRSTSTRRTRFGITSQVVVATPGAG